MGDLSFRFGNPRTYKGEGERLFFNNHHPSLVTLDNKTLNHFLIYMNGTKEKQSIVYEFKLPSEFESNPLNWTTPDIYWSYSNPELFNAKIINASEKLTNDQIQPASLDLRLGRKAWRVRSSFLPGSKNEVKSKISRLSMHEIDLSKGAVLEKGCVYIAEIMENLDQFRKDTKAWLEENCPPEMRKPMGPGDVVWGGRNCKFPHPDAKLWLERMGEKGWTAPAIPKEYGGGGLDRDQIKILNEELFAIGARPPLNSFGIWMLAPVIIEYGNEAQKLEHIPKIIKGEIRWCQGYSEPGSGSDLASLSTKAEDMGDHYLVNGQKVWTSYADKADWIFALVRTGPKEPKHTGISFLSLIHI